MGDDDDDDDGDALPLRVVAPFLRGLAVLEVEGEEADAEARTDEAKEVAIGGGTAVERRGDGGGVRRGLDDDATLSRAVSDARCHVQM